MARNQLLLYTKNQMKKNIFLPLFLLFLTSVACGQNTSEQKYLLTTKVNTFGMSTLSFIDPYLSPLVYSGVGLQYNYDTRRFLSPDKNNISMEKRLSLVDGMTLNPANSASMTYLGINYAWGMHYHYRPMQGFQFLIGGLLDVDFGLKDLVRNVNNPINIDLATNLNFSGVAMYNIFTRKRILRLQFALQTPLLGVMFVPRNGVSYYEMFELNDMSNTTHFSSLHNKYGLNQTLTLDVPFKYSTWRFGVNVQNLKYSANDMVFERNEVSLLIGTTFDVATFAGRKNVAPANFISTNE